MIVLFKSVTKVPSHWFHWEWDLSQGRQQYACTLWAAYMSFKQTDGKQKLTTFNMPILCLRPISVKLDLAHRLKKLLELRTSDYYCYYLQHMEHADVNILLQKIILQSEAFIYFLAMFLV